MQEKSLGFCTLYFIVLKVCCTDSLSTLYFPFTETEDANSNVTEEQSIDSFTVLSDLLPNATICKVRVKDRIMVGTRVSENEFPWMALLEYNKRNCNILS